MPSVILVTTMVIGIVPNKAAEGKRWHSENECAVRGSAGLLMAVIHNYEAIQGLHQEVNELASLEVLHVLSVLLLQNNVEN